MAESCVRDSIKMRVGVCVYALYMILRKWELVYVWMFFMWY